MTNYHYRMYQVANALDEQEVRERLVQSKRQSRQIQLPNIVEHLESVVEKFEALLAGTPKPSQECC
ncbi:MAG: hypothetical protein PVJ23_08415 [Anaerolineae bacterium]